MAAFSATLRGGRLRKPPSAAAFGAHQRQLHSAAAEGGRHLRAPKSAASAATEGGCLRHPLVVLWFVESVLNSLNLIMKMHDRDMSSPPCQTSNLVVVPCLRGMMFVTLGLSRLL